MDLERFFAAFASHLPPDVLQSGDIIAIHSTIHNMPASERNAAASSLAPSEAALFQAVALIPPRDVASVAEAIPSLVQSLSAPTQAGDQQRLEALGTAHRLLTSLPADALAALEVQLPPPMQPLLGLASDLEPDEFAELARPILAAVLPPEGAPDVESASRQSPMHQLPVPHQLPPPSHSRGMADVSHETAGANRLTTEAQPSGSVPSNAPPCPPPAPPLSAPLQAARAAQTLLKSQLRLQRRFILASEPSHPRVLGLVCALIAAPVSLVCLLVRLFSLHVSETYVVTFALALAALLAVIEAEGATATRLIKPAMRRLPCLRTTGVRRPPTTTTTNATNATTTTTTTEHRYRYRH